LFKLKLKRGEKPPVKSPAKFSAVSKMSQSSDVQEENTKQEYSIHSLPQSMLDRMFPF